MAILTRTLRSGDDGPEEPHDPTQPGGRIDTVVGCSIDVRRVLA